MEIKEIQNKKVWEDFLLNCTEKTFLQSWNWGEANLLMGNKIWRLGVYDQEKLLATCLVSLIGAKRGRFLLIQHGPNIKNSKFQILNKLLEKLKEIAKKENASFIRVAPLLERNEENIKLFKNLGFREAPMHANAYEATWKMDITLSEEELLKNMRKTTRYLIRQAMKNQDIVIEKSEKAEDAKIYQELNQEVAKRQKFVPFPFEFIKNEFEIFAKEKQALWFFGKYKSSRQKFGSQDKKQIIAGALILFWSGIGFYHQAALLSQYHKIPVVYLLQWKAIREAKKRGCKIYDFWGFVDPKKYPHHPWAGPTLFKMGFGGQPYKYVKTQDFVLSKRYWLTWIFEKMRKIKRGL